MDIVSLKTRGPGRALGGLILDGKIQVSSSCWPAQPLLGAGAQLLRQTGTGCLGDLASLEGGCLPQADGMQVEQTEGPFKIHSVELKSEKWLTRGSLPFEEFV